MIAVAKDFSNYLVNRNSAQGDGTFTGEDFRKKFLKDLDSPEWWSDSSKKVEIDFDGVRTLGPSWVNEVFAYFTQSVAKDVVLRKIEFKNISETKMEIIRVELESGYVTDLEE